MNQGDVFWYTFKEPDKRRPVLVLTRNSALRFLSGIAVAPITTIIRSIPTEVVLDEQDGMHARCVVNVDNIQTIQRARFGPYIAHLAPARMRAVRQAIEFAFGFDALE